MLNVSRVPIFANFAIGMIDNEKGHLSLLVHYENTPIQYTVIFHDCKNDYFQMKIFDIFLFFAQNIHRGYTLERVPTIYVLEQNKEKNVYPYKPQLYYIKVGCKGV